MLKEYDIVKSLIRLNDKVPAESIGTVLIIYPGSSPAYEVEFVNSAHETLDVLTVEGKDIMKLEI